MVIVQNKLRLPLNSAGTKKKSRQENEQMLVVSSLGQHSQQADFKGKYAFTSSEIQYSLFQTILTHLRSVTEHTANSIQGAM